VKCSFGPTKTRVIHLRGYSGGYNQAAGLIQALKAKGSVKFGPESGAEFFGQGEGAKETLGELLM